MSGYHPSAWETTYRRGSPNTRMRWHLWAAAADMLAAGATFERTVERVGVGSDLLRRWMHNAGVRLRTQHSAETRAAVIAAVKAGALRSVVAQQHGLHPSTVNQWCKHLPQPTRAERARAAWYGVQSGAPA